MPHTAYSAAKFAVKGFSEALIADLRVNAPHVKVSVVMPGHIGTSIAANSRKIQAGNESDEISTTELAQARARIASTGKDASGLTDHELRDAEKNEGYPATVAGGCGLDHWVPPVRSG